MTNKKMEVEIKDFMQLMRMVDPEFTPDPPRDDEEIIRIRSLDRRQVTKIVKVDETTFRFVGIEKL